MDPEYIATRPIVNMKSCVPGQKLITRMGKVFEYVEYCPDSVFPHTVATDGHHRGTRTDEGWTFRNNPLYTDEDIIYIVPVDGVVR